MPSEPLLVARIGKPHGLLGEVTVQTHTDDPERRFVEGAEFSTLAAAGTGVPRSLTVRSARRHNTVWLLAFEQVPDRTGAESLRGTRLLLDDAAAATDQDEEAQAWYEADLLGLTAYDPSGVLLGEVAGLEASGAQDRLVLRLTDGHEAQVPFVEAIVPVVDVQGRRVVVDAPPGLLDLGRD